MKWKRREEEAVRKSQKKEKKSKKRRAEEMKRSRQKASKLVGVLSTIMFLLVSALVVTSLSLYRNFALVLSDTGRFSANMQAMLVPRIEDWLAQHEQPETENLPVKQSPTTDLAVFYNAYISHEQPELAHQIIEEQIDTISKSYAASPHINTTVFYVTVGRSLPDDFMGRVCTERNMKCQHLKHYREGFEDLTLALLYDHCQRNPDQKVMYLHSKGKNCVVGLESGYPSIDSRI